MVEVRFVIRMHVVIKSYTTHPQNEEKTEKDYKKTYVYCVNVQVF